MDDIFTAFDAAASAQPALARPAAGVKRGREPTPAAAGGAPIANSHVAPPSTSDAGAGSGAGTAAGAAGVVSRNAAAPSPARRGRAQLGAAVVDDITRAGAALSEEGAVSARAAARAAFSSATLLSDDSPAGKSAPLKSVAMEIGESLRAALTRGEIDDSKTTAPEANIASSESARPPPARVYPFTLDPFQQRSIDCLERDESVLVSAHTSAGKTVVAEYAIAMALRDKQRVIYTSPIKALSNQKYRDFFETFEDVGLMTGDVTINPSASCLVMTTEILRSMLYRGSEVMREVKWVVFDEVHYMRDKERGVVWEESIILLPHQVRFVFLSATIPNAKEFAAWVAKIHSQTCHVVYTDYRPTPLQHFIFPAGGEGVYLVVDEKGKFREDNFTKAMATLTTSALDDAVADVTERGGGKRKTAKNSGAKGKGGASDLYRIVKMVMERRYDPVIIFSFSKRECETYAMQLSTLDFSSDAEKALIKSVFMNAIDALSEDDKSLPMIESALPLLLRGIGVHHGGLLPILKEVIEILFQESLLKILFATETFSMGINMPARTVIFTASRKFDGVDFRFISPGEYIQMSGRAGRRGLDDRGIVIQMVDEKLEPAAAMEILKGTADALNSAFHIGYNMLLNLLRLEGGDPERLMALSFHQFQLERAAPAIEAAADDAEAERDAALERAGDAEARAELESYAALCNAADLVDDALRTIMMASPAVLPFLQAGRLARVPGAWGWGLILGFARRVPPPGTIGAPDPVEEPKRSSGGGGASASANVIVTVDVLLHCVPGGGAPQPASAEDITSGRSDVRAVPVALSALVALSSVRVQGTPRDPSGTAERRGLAERLRETLRRLGDSPPVLDAVSDLRLAGENVLELVSRRTDLRERVAASPFSSVAGVPARLAALNEASAAAARAVTLREKARGCTALAQRDILRRKKRVLRRLGLLSVDNVVQIKGRVAAEVNSADELLVTELIFSGAFNALDAAGAAALLSALVYQEKSSAADDAKEKPALREEFAGPLRVMQDAARRIATVSNDSGLEIDVEEYVASFNPGMMELVAAWVNGARFVDVAAMTKEFEGTIIRVIRRLEELTRQLGDAAKAIGDNELETKFKEASTKMRRDIVFAASLYL